MGQSTGGNSSMIGGAGGVMPSRVTPTQPPPVTANGGTAALKVASPAFSPDVAPFVPSTATVTVTAGAAAVTVTGTPAVVPGE